MLLGEILCFGYGHYCTSSQPISFVMFRAYFPDHRDLLKVLPSNCSEHKHL